MKGSALCGGACGRSLSALRPREAQCAEKRKLSRYGSWEPLKTERPRLADAEHSAGASRAAIPAASAHVNGEAQTTIHQMRGLASNAIWKEWHAELPSLGLDGNGTPLEYAGGSNW
jgi:hypothetical protein